jgi:transposase InsO family protein
MWRRPTATTDQPIYPNCAKDLAIDGPDQLWVADITYVAIREGFAYVAVILDAWSRRAIGYAISRSIDVCLTLAALNTAVERRKPPPGCIHHSDRGSQYAAQGYREALLRHDLVGSMGRRGNPYDNPKAESFMKSCRRAIVLLAALCASKRSRTGKSKPSSPVSKDVDAQLPAASRRLRVEGRYFDGEPPSSG